MFCQTGIFATDKQNPEFLWKQKIVFVGWHSSDLDLTGTLILCSFARLRKVVCLYAVCFTCTCIFVFRIYACIQLYVIMSTGYTLLAGYLPR